MAFLSAFRPLRLKQLEEEEEVVREEEEVVRGLGMGGVSQDANSSRVG